MQSELITNSCMKSVGVTPGTFWLPVKCFTDLLIVRPGTCCRLTQHLTAVKQKVGWADWRGRGG